MPFPVDTLMIEATEAALGVSFPESFTKKMRADNGGSVVAAPAHIRADQRDDWYWELVPFFDASSKKRLSRTCNDVVKETLSARQWAGFPADAVVVGCGIGGDLLIFRRSSSRPVLDDAVYWWDHETRLSEKVADDFAELAPA